MANLATSTAKGTGKFVRFLFWTVLSLISLGAMVVVGVFLYFDPNDYKEEISHYITQKSGLPLEIHGNINMTYFPSLGLSVQNVTMTQPATFGEGNFIEIKSLDFKMPLREIFDKQFIVETLTLKGVQIHLIQKKDGATNWDSASSQVKQKSSSSTQSDKKETLDATHTPSSPRKKLTLALKQFDISDGVITFENREKGEVYTLSELTLKGKESDAAKTYPLHGKFKLKQYNALLKKEFMNGQINIDGKFGLSGNLNAAFNVSADLTLPQNEPGLKDITAKSMVTLKPNKTLLLEDIQVKVGENDIKGNVTIPAGTAPINFTLNLKELNLDKFSGKIPKQSKVSGEAKLVKTQYIQPAPTNKKSNGRVLSGDITIDKLTHERIVLTNVKAKVNKSGDIVKINPLTASLFEGTLKAQITKELNNPAKPTLIQGDVTDIQIQPLLITLKNEKRISGTGSFNFNLMQHNDVNGIVKVGIKNGVIEGLDVKYYLSVAQSLVSKDKTPIEDTKQTKFGELTATLKLHDQMIDNNDLSIIAPDFKANGEGSVWLGSKTIEYKLQAYKVHSDNQTRPDDYPLAIRIKGSLDHPKIQPDVDVYIKKALEQELQKQLGKQLEKNIGKVLGVPSNDQQNSEGAQNNELQQKLEDKLNRGLKKLFKKKE